MSVRHKAEISLPIRQFAPPIQKTVALRQDHLGPYLLVRGWIFRPLRIPDQMPAVVQAKRVPWTPLATVKHIDGTSGDWLDCGDACVYWEARATMASHAFERFTAMETSLAMVAQGLPARQSYAALFDLHPPAGVDYKSLFVKDHLLHAKRLRDVVKARQRQASQARVSLGMA